MDKNFIQLVSAMLAELDKLTYERLIESSSVRIGSLEARIDMVISLLQKIGTVVSDQDDITYHFRIVTDNYQAVLTKDTVKIFTQMRKENGEWVWMETRKGSCIGDG